VKQIVIWLLFVVCIANAASAQETEISKSRIIETYKGKQYYIHFVDQGQTLFAISRAYGVSLEEVKLANPDAGETLKPNQMLMIPFVETSAAGPQVIIIEKGKTVEPIAVPVQPKQTDSGQIQHIVAPKETWYALSRQYQVPVKEIISANPGVDTLRIGMTVNIPPAPEKIIELPPRYGFVTYVVAPKETLYGIATRFKITVEELVNINPVLKEGLKVDQLIYVPSITSVADQTPGSGGFTLHEVKRKETLYSISKMYNVDIKDILVANPGLDGKLRKNDIIRIPVKKEPVVVPPENKIIQGRDVFQEAMEPVKPMVCLTQPHRQVFNVALMIPFQLDYADSIRVSDPSSLKLPSDFRSLDFIQFYEGAMIAAEDVAGIGANIKIHAFDTDAGSSLTKTRRVLSGQTIRDMDLIIGPFFANSFELVSAFAMDHKIPIVNPLSERSEIIEANPYVVKMQPSGWSSYSNAAQKIASVYPDANFTIMRRDHAENNSMASVFQSALSKTIENPGRIHEVVYSQVYASGLIKSLVPGKTNVIFLLTSDKALIPSLLRQLNDVREKYNIVVVGLADWEDMEMDFSYLHNLEAHFFSPWFVDYRSDRVTSYIAEFRKRYEGEPELERYAYLGYDITRYFLEAMYNFGPDFLNCLPDINNPMLSSDFRFYKTPSGGYENTGVMVYKLKDFSKIGL